MALQDSISLAPGAPTIGTGTPSVYVLTRRDSSGTERLDNTTDLSAPSLFVVKHAVQGSEKNGGVITDRHLVQLIRTERDVNNVAHRLVVNATIIAPRVGLFDAAEVNAQMWKMCNFFQGSAVIAAIMRGES